MINAAEARNYVAKPNQKEIDDIELKIIRAVTNSEDFVYLYERLSPAMESYLKENGYTVKSETDRDGLLVTITWGKPTQVKTTFEKVFEDFAEFSKATFVQSTAFSSLEHLKEEVEELSHEVLLNSGRHNQHTQQTPEMLEEYADCVLCIISSATRAGITAEQIVSAMGRKTQINKARKWKLNPNNTYSHIKE